MEPVIGVLALQGAYAEHVAMLRRMGLDAPEVRMPAQLDELDGLIIPGGESTAMGLIAQRWGLVEPLRNWVAAARPTWGTCAGMILLAARAAGQKTGGQPLIGGLDVTVNRNYFGRQINSFETVINAPAVGDTPYPAIFIRAPAVVEMGPAVQSLASMDGLRGERIHVAVQQGPILATAFHPELTQDLRWHVHFVAMAASAQARVLPDSAS